MSRELCDDLNYNFQQACRQLKILIERFDDDHWHKGISKFETPVNVAFHAIECLDYFFTNKWESKFGGGWWELPEEKKPTPRQLVSYLSEIEEKISFFFGKWDDSDLARPHDGKCSNLRYFLYALRHTMHHQGGLNVLSVHAGIDIDGWADEP